MEAQRLELLNRVALGCGVTPDDAAAFGVVAALFGTRRDHGAAVVELDRGIQLLARAVALRPARPRHPDSRTRRDRDDLVAKRLRQLQRIDVRARHRLDERRRGLFGEDGSSGSPQLEQPGERTAMIEPGNGVAQHDELRREQERELRHGERRSLALEHAVDGDAFVWQDRDVETERPRRTAVPDERRQLGVLVAQVKPSRLRDERQDPIEQRLGDAERRARRDVHVLQAERLWIGGAEQQRQDLPVVFVGKVRDVGSERGRRVSACPTRHSSCASGDGPAPSAPRRPGPRTG